MLTFVLLAPGISPSGKTTDYAFEVDLIIHSFLKIFISVCIIFGCQIFVAHAGSLLQQVGSFFSRSMQTLSFDMWDLVPWPGIEPRPTALGEQSLRHWTTREVPIHSFFYEWPEKIQPEYFPNALLSHLKSVINWCSGWHHWLDGCESEWTLGVCDGQGGLACCDSWGRKESDTIERLNWTEPYCLITTYLAKYFVRIMEYKYSCNMSNA